MHIVVSSDWQLVMSFIPLRDLSLIIGRSRASKQNKPSVHYPINSEMFLSMQNPPSHTLIESQLSRMCRLLITY